MQDKVSDPATRSSDDRFAGQPNMRRVADVSSDVLKSRCLRTLQYNDKFCTFLMLITFTNITKRLHFFK